MRNVLKQVVFSVVMLLVAALLEVQSYRVPTDLAQWYDIGAFIAFVAALWIPLGDMLFGESTNMEQTQKQGRPLVLAEMRADTAKLMREGAAIVRAQPGTREIVTNALFQLAQAATLAGAATLAQMEANEVNERQYVLPYEQQTDELIAQFLERQAAFYADPEKYLAELPPTDTVPVTTTPAIPARESAIAAAMLSGPQPHRFSAPN